MIDEQPKPSPTLERAMAFGRFINEVGLPSVVVMVIVGVSTSILMGWTPSPWVSKDDFRLHVTTNDTMHASMLQQSSQNTEALKAITEAMQAMNCDNKKADLDKLKCFRRMNGGDN